MTLVEQLENNIIDQIQKLNDDSLFEDKEAAKTLIDRSKTMSELSDSFIEIQRAKLEHQRVKIEAVKTMHEVSVGTKTDKTIRQYLGIGEDK